MARDTSAQAYQNIKDNGVLTKRQEQVYETVYHIGPIGSRAVWEEIKKTHPNVPHNSISPRFKQLIREGVLKEVGEYECPYTKETVTCYDVTSKVLSRRNHVGASPTKGKLLRDYLDNLDDTVGDKKVAVCRVTKNIRKKMGEIGI